MKQYKIDLVYMGMKTTLDLRRVVAISHPKNGKFVIYFENAIWTIEENQFKSVYDAWMAV